MKFTSNVFFNIASLLALSLLAEGVLAQDWQRYRQDVRRCAPSDATCVGLTLIDVLQELHYRRDYQVNCNCSGHVRQTRMSCLVSDRGIRRVIPEQIPFTFSSNCQSELTAAREKWAFCTDGFPRSSYKLYSINPMDLSFDLLGEFSFRSNCHEALADL